MVQGQITIACLQEYKGRVLEKRQNTEGRKILIVGDVGLDEYIFGEVNRISPEAPVPVLDATSEELRLGLAANVAQNIASLGGVPILLSVVGDDNAAGTLRKLLESVGVATDQLIVDVERPTTRKTRIISGLHHIVRVDHERRKFLSETVEKQLLEKVKSHLPDCDGVVIEDYGKGVVSENFAQEVIGLSHSFGKTVLVDPHRTTPLEYFKGVDIATPNRDEAFLLAGYPEDDLRQTEDTLIEVGRKLQERLSASQIVMTRGKEGMSLFEGERLVHFPTYARDVFDVVGAGDTVIAALGLAWGSGFSPEESCVFANYAAGVVVAKVGCQPCTMDELVSYMESH